MEENEWEAVDNYLNAFVLGEDEMLQSVLDANAAAELPSIDVTPTQGRFLTVICLAAGVRSVLEIGTLGGYSTICLARGVGPEGKVLTLERSERHAGVATANLERSGLRDRVEIRTGPALESLAAMEEAATKETFDLFFIDADKENNPAYFEAALKFAHPGSIIIVDNVVRGGSVLKDSDDLNDIGTKRLLETVGGRQNLKATVIQTVGAKGWDGFLLATVL